MRLRKHRRFLGTLIVVGATLGSAVAAYGILVLTLGVSQPLMLVASGSMEPAIQVGDIISVHAVSPSQVRLGEVIVYQYASYFKIIHRVVCIATSVSSQCLPPWHIYLACPAPPCYYTKGDSELGPDPWIVRSSDILGVWTGFRIPYFGMALTCLRQDSSCSYPWGSLSLIILGSVVASDVGFEYWLSRRSSGNQKQDPSKSENGEVAA